MSSTAGSTMPSADRVTRAAVVLHGRPEALGSGLARLEAVAKQEGVELVDDGRRARSWRRPTSQVAIVLGGDGTMLRALQRVPRDGHPGDRRQLRPGRASSARSRATSSSGASRACSPVSSRPSSSRRSRSRRAASGYVAVNDAVVTSGELGRMVELEWSIGGEDFGRVPCDGLICSTPVRLDRLQPLERRAGADVGARRDGADVRRSPRPPGAAVRRAPRPRPPRLEPDARRRLRRPRRRPPRRRRGLGCSACRSGSASSGRSSARCRRRRSCGATGRASAAPEALQPSRGLSHRDRCAAGAAGLPSTAMLRRLRIENLVLIREAELELTAGLNVLSGETGAGKTIFAQAIGLLLGVKGDAGAVGPAASEAYVEAEFDVPDGFFDESRAARRSPSCGRRTSRGSCSRAACSETAARGRTRGGGRSRARISPRRRSG